VFFVALRLGQTGGVELSVASRATLPDADPSSGAAFDARARLVYFATVDGRCGCTAAAATSGNSLFCGGRWVWEASGSEMAIPHRSWNEMPSDPSPPLPLHSASQVTCRAWTSPQG